jgi:hypothetical protein
MWCPGSPQRGPVCGVSVPAQRVWGACARVVGSPTPSQATPVGGVAHAALAGWGGETVVVLIPGCSTRSSHPRWAPLSGPCRAGEGAPGAASGRAVRRGSAPRRACGPLRAARAVSAGRYVLSGPVGRAGGVPGGIRVPRGQPGPSPCRSPGRGGGRVDPPGPVTHRLQRRPGGAAVKRAARSRGWLGASRRSRSSRPCAGRARASSRASPRCRGPRGAPRRDGASAGSAW